ncbi:Cysteine/Histidine-rich C1 domain family protein, putative [Theobroma cacao]|uniref:Cysteine/Histidine-rich C1 domain family protein, putative n=1 Tax=Theobroma cacao TaxID=3641 RepID=A0A061FP96_THECC|nr:Cysteine/Histidine-rich C1 domain family protein, putative [Theobroma cacao]
MQIHHFNHHHPLNFHEVQKEDENLGCKACKLEIHGPAYIYKECGYYLHKACTELPNEVVYPLHPQHALNLLTRSLNTRHFICDEYGDISDGFLYFCFECQFKVDVKCAGLNAHRNQGQGFPEKMQHPFHPLQLLRAKIFLTKSCHAYDFLFVGISYSCLECDLHLHPTCLNSMRQGLKFNLRTCNLDFFYFGIGCQMLFNGYTCLRCDESCAGPSVSVLRLI